MVVVRRFVDAAEFNRRVEPFLLAHEAEHNLLLGLCTTLIHAPQSFSQPPYLACVEQQGQVVLVAIQTPPYNLVLSLSALADDDSPVAAVVDDYWSSFPGLEGVSGPTAVSKAFAEAWSRRSGLPYHPHFQHRIYRLEKVRPPTGVSGVIRPATRSDYDLLIDWVFAFNAEALDRITREQAARTAETILTADPALRGLRFWVDGGQTVSMAAYTGRTPNGIRINLVYTPPACRGRGYASAIVAALSQEMLDQGRKFCFLFTDLENPTSNHIYQQIGYAPVADVDAYRFGEE